MRMDTVSDGQTEKLAAWLRYRLEPVGADPVVLKLNRQSLKATSGGREAPIADLTIECGSAPKAKIMMAANRIDGRVGVKHIGKQRIQFLSAKRLTVEQIIAIVGMFCEELERALTVTQSPPPSRENDNKGFVDRSNVVAISTARTRQSRRNHPAGKG